MAGTENTPKAVATAAATSVWRARPARPSVEGCKGLRVGVIVEFPVVLFEEVCSEGATGDPRGTTTFAQCPRFLVRDWRRTLCCSCVTARMRKHDDFITACALRLWFFCTSALYRDEYAVPGAF